MLEEIHQNIMVILECLRGRIMGNSISSCAFFSWIFQVFYNQNVLFYNKEINFKKKQTNLALPGRKCMPTKQMRWLGSPEGEGR